jgi:putative sigma-54 modulation protein
MKINVRGRNLEITEAINTYAIEKLERLYKYTDKLDSLEAVLTKTTKNEFEVEIIAMHGSNKIIAKSEGKDLYDIIDATKNKIKNLIQKQKFTYNKH